MISDKQNQLNQKAFKKKEEALKKDKGLRVMHRVDCHTHVPRIFATAIKISIVFRYQINIMKYETFKIVQFQSFDKANVEQLGTIEFRLSGLVLNETKHNTIMNEVERKDKQKVNKVVPVQSQK